MKKFKSIISVIVTFCMLVSFAALPGIPVVAEVTTGIMVADSANRSDFSPVPEKVDYWQNYYVSGGTANSWLWKTEDGNDAIFRFDLPDTAVSFEPYFEGENNVQPFKIYASSNGTDWVPVVEITESYLKNTVYNSTTGVEQTGGYASGGKATAGIAFDTMNSTNISAVLEGNESKIVYLKVSDLLTGNSIELRAFGLTYDYTDEVVVDPETDLFGIMVADSANRSDYDTKSDESDYWQNYYVSGGESLFWLWKTLPASPAIFRFDLNDTATSFEPYFEGEDTAQSFTIYASKNQIDWLPVAGMEVPYEKNKVYNSTTGLSTGDYAVDGRSTSGNVFDFVNTANVNLVLTDNPTKVIYLKVDDIADGSEIQIRAFGVTFDFTGIEEEPDPVNNGIKVGNSANRSDYDTNNTKTDYWNNYYISGGESVYWLWKTVQDNPAVFRFNLPDSSSSFEPYFEGEDIPQSFVIYGSKNQDEWLPVAAMESVYEKNKVYNSTTGLSTGDYATGGKATAGNAFDVIYEENIAIILDENDSKVVYLKIGDNESEIQLRAFGITYTFTGEDDPGTDDDYVEPPLPDRFYTDPYDNNPEYEIKTEFRVAVSNENEYTDDITTYLESELADEPMQGEIVNGNRLLVGNQSMIFTFEVDPDAIFIKLDGWDANTIEGHDGSQLFNIGIYSSEAEEFLSIVDCGTENGPLMPPRFNWNRFDNTWGRDGNNEYYVTNAGINEETGKKIVQIRLMGQFNYSYDGVLFYKSFLVQSVVPVSDDVVDDNDDDQEEENSNGESEVENEDDDVTQPGDSANLASVILIATLAAASIIISRRRNLKSSI